MAADWLERDALERHSLDARQFIDFRHATLPNGTRIIEAYNSSGLTFTILPDRGLDIWTAHYGGTPLTWVSPGSPHPPDFGQTWLQQFNGGLLTTCGLTHAGPSENDAETGAFRDLHGRYNRLRANDIVTHGAWRADGARYVLELRGTVTQTALFGPQLVLERAYSLVLGEPSIMIHDRVTNIGDAATPLMLVYHCNVGYPLVRAGVRLHTPHEAVYPRDDEARAGFDRWPDYDAATAGYAEQVFFHHLKHDGQTEIALAGDDFGLSLSWDARRLPYFTQWKNTRQGIYVSGIEPGNCIPEGQNTARERGRLVMLEPGQTDDFHCVLQVLDGADAVQQCRGRIDELRLSGVPAAACKLDDFAL